MRNYLLTIAILALAFTMLNAVTAPTSAPWSRNYIIGAYSYAMVNDDVARYPSMANLGYNLCVQDIDSTAALSFIDIANSAHLDVVAIDRRFDPTASTPIVGLYKASWSNYYRYEMENLSGNTMWVESAVNTPRFDYRIHNYDNATSLLDRFSDINISNGYGVRLRGSSTTPTTGTRAIRTIIARRWDKASGQYVSTTSEDSNLNSIKLPPISGSSFANTSADDYFYLEIRMKVNNVSSLGSNTVFLQLCPAFSDSNGADVGYHPTYVCSNSIPANTQVSALSDVNSPNFYSMTLANTSGASSGSYFTFTMKVRYGDLVSHLACFSRYTDISVLRGASVFINVFPNTDVNVDYIDVYDTMYNKLIKNPDATYTAAVNNGLSSLFSKSNLIYSYSLDEPLPVNLNIIPKLRQSVITTSSYKNRFFTAQQRNWKAFGLPTGATGNSSTPAFNLLDLTHTIAQYPIQDHNSTALSDPVLCYDEYPLINNMSWNSTPSTSSGFDYDDTMKTLSTASSPTHVQNCLDYMLSNYRWIRSTSASTLFYPVVQTCYQKDKTTSIMTRIPPTQAMQQALKLLPLCYGANGTLDYRVHLTYTNNALDNGFHGFHPLNLTNSIPLFIPQLLAIQSANKKLAQYGPVVNADTWLAGNANDRIIADLAGRSPLLAITVANSDDGNTANNLDYTGYVETGVYQNSSSQYDFMFVNRRSNKSLDEVTNNRSYTSFLGSQVTADAEYTTSSSSHNLFVDADPQTVTLTFNDSIDSSYCLYDPYDPEGDGFGSIVFIKYNGSGQPYCSFVMQPGEGRLFKLIPLNSTQITQNRVTTTTVTSISSASGLPTLSESRNINFTGNVTIANNMVFNNLVAVSSSASLTISSGCTVVFLNNVSFNNRITVNSGASVVFLGTTNTISSISLASGANIYSRSVLQITHQYCTSSTLTGDIYGGGVKLMDVNSSYSSVPFYGTIYDASVGLEVVSGSISMYGSINRCPIGLELSDEDAIVNLYGGATFADCNVGIDWIDGGATVNFYSVNDASRLNFTRSEYSLTSRGIRFNECLHTPETREWSYFYFHNIGYCFYRSTTSRASLHTYLTLSHMTADNIHSLYYTDDSHFTITSGTGNSITNTRDNNDNLPIPSLSFSTSNYPNPFNPETTIAFDLPADADTKLVVFNARGQKIKTLVDEPMQAGSHTVVWKGIDDHGDRVPSGMYLYRIQAAGKSITNKMILVK